MTPGVNGNNFRLCAESNYPIQYLKIFIKSTTSKNFDYKRVFLKSIIDESRVMCKIAGIRANPHKYENAD
jgi:hypothetical protein